MITSAVEWAYQNITYCTRCYVWACVFLCKAPWRHMLIIIGSRFSEKAFHRNRIAKAFSSPHRLHDCLPSFTSIIFIHPHSLRIVPQPTTSWSLIHRLKSPQEAVQDFGTRYFHKQSMLPIDMSNQDRRDDIMEYTCVCFTLPAVVV